MFIYLMVMTDNKNLVDEVLAGQIAELFRALGDTSRIQIIAALTKNDLNVGELADLVKISHSAVSHHLRHLRQMKLVRTHKEGRHVFYSLDDDHVRDLFLCGLEHAQHG